MEMQQLMEYEAMAKLALPQEERELLLEKMNLLEKSFLALETVDTGDTEPMFTVLELRNVLREDISRHDISREDILAGAPEQYDGYFQVPKTLD